MTDNSTGEENVANSAGTQSEKPANEIVPTNEIETIKPNQETENMEIHKHPHHVTRKKKWGEYLLEFLMLFLAVFLGFLAENIREHKVEREREKEYVGSLMNDLKADLINIDSVQNKYNQTRKKVDSLFLVLNSADYASSTNLTYYFGRIISSKNYFNMRDGTLKQLTNAGGLRLVRQRDVVESLQAYQNLNSEVVKAEELKEIQLQHYRDAMCKVFDARVFEKMVNGLETKMPPGNPALFSQNKEMINELLMRAHFVKRNIAQLVDLLDGMRLGALNLKKTINENYHIE